MTQVTFIAAAIRTEVFEFVERRMPQIVLRQRTINDEQLQQLIGNHVCGIWRRPIISFNGALEAGAVQIPKWKHLDSHSRKY
ncbi:MULTISPECIES: hypothetical protein [unclassified Caballeronia]|uniref:hypothetical protein n=1 Tax=unclassified Caballeronia TaxID=2646786 RepID=UPI0020291F04|nr:MULTISPECIES: hypothetical protein [unclassified Caballeronia]